MDKKKKTGEGQYKKRYATLKEHRAAVAAQKLTKKGKNVGPVAHGGTYASAIKKKPAAPKAKAKPVKAKPAPVKAKPTPVKAKATPVKAKATPAVKKSSTDTKPVSRTTPKAEVKSPARTSIRQRNRRGGSTAQERRTKARQRGLAKNKREQVQAERRRTFYPNKKKDKK